MRRIGENWTIKAKWRLERFQTRCIWLLDPFSPNRKFSHITVGQVKKECNWLVKDQMNWKYLKKKLYVFKHLLLEKIRTFTVTWVTSYSVYLGKAEGGGDAVIRKKTISPACKGRKIYLCFLCWKENRKYKRNISKSMPISNWLNEWDVLIAV